MFVGLCLFCSVLSCFGVNQLKVNLSRLYGVAEVTGYEYGNNIIISCHMMLTCSYRFRVLQLNSDQRIIEKAYQVSVMGNNTQ